MTISYRPTAPPSACFMTYLLMQYTLFAAICGFFSPVAASSVLLRGGITDSQWNELNSTVNGRLFYASPLARPCYFLAQGVAGDFNTATCESVMDNYTNRDYRVNVFAAYMNTEWETCQSTSSQCLLNDADPQDTLAFSPPSVCEQGSISSYYIDVRSPSDVQSAFSFARITGINLAIKSTGHDYIGRSSAPDSLGIWIHNLQSLAYDADFVPSACPPSSGDPAITFESGVLQERLFEFAEANHVTFPGGSSTSIAAAGGYLQGGGHSAISNVFGLAVDRVLQAKVVTPRGDYLTANRCQNTDLFFALRGGGGSTFGVVMEVTMKALPRITLTTAVATFNGTDERMESILQFMISHSLFYAQRGWGGYVLPRQSIIFTNPILGIKEAADDMAELQAFLDSLADSTSTFSLTVIPSFLSFFNEFLASSVPVGVPSITSSRLIPVDNFATNTERGKLLDALMEVFRDSSFPIVFAVAPFLYNQTEETSVTDAWRRSLWHITSSASWSFNTTTDTKIRAYQGLTKKMDTLRDITPGSGAYQNEADIHEPNFEASFWGNNYERLVAIKRKYDPDHLLDCWHCVDWKGAKDPKYKCYI
ncbi:FAD-binding domain-containing protein [Mucidula mucida]|nr:FAD-binding domain-containing protein [Mucidula mucida]